MPHLSEHQQLVVRRVAGFAETFSLEAVDAVCVDEILDHDAVARALRACCDHGVILPDTLTPEVRLRLAETWFHRAQTRLAEAGETDLVDQRLVRYYSALAQQVLEHAFGPARASWIARLVQEAPNLDALLGRLVDRGAAEPGLQLALLLVELWFEPPHTRHGRVWFAALLALPHAAARTSLRARALDLAGALALADGDYATARALMDEGLAIVRELDDHARLGYGLLHLGHLVGNAQGDYVAARAMYQEGLETLQGIDQDEGIAHAVSGLAGVALELGEYETAAPLARDCLQRYQRLGMPWNVAMALLTAANVAAGQGFNERAVRLAGAATVQLDAIGVSQPAVYQARHQRLLERARTAVVDEARREALWADGQALSLDEAVTYSLTSETEPPALG